MCLLEAAYSCLVVLCLSDKAKGFVKKGHWRREQQGQGAPENCLLGLTFQPSESVCVFGLVSSIHLHLG